MRHRVSDSRNIGKHAYAIRSGKPTRKRRGRDGSARARLEQIRAGDAQLVSDSARHIELIGIHHELAPGARVFGNLFVELPEIAQPIAKRLASCNEVIALMRSAARKVSDSEQANRRHRHAGEAEDGIRACNYAR